LKKNKFIQDKIKEYNIPFSSFEKILMKHTNYSQEELFLIDEIDLLLLEKIEQDINLFNK